jgi:uncharacterized protein (DUF4415 family)
VSRSSQPGGDPVREVPAEVEAPCPTAGPAPDLTGQSTRELASLPIDRDVMARLKAAGPGWQERVNAILREACGLAGPGPRDEGLRPGELTAENDD